MHFWIDKRSQCAYNGRHRVPSSISSGRSRGRVCVGGGGGAGAGAGGARKFMAAPVHRFAAVDPPRRPLRNHRPYPPPAVPSVHNSARRQNEEIYVQIPMEPPQPTIAQLAAARSVTPDTLLRTAALGLQPSPMMAPHLKYGMLVSFAIATMFLTGAKLYFDKEVVRESSSGAEAAVVCAALACVCSVGCALAQCRAPPRPLPPPERVSSTARRAPPQPARPAHPAPRADNHHAQSDQLDDISLATLLQSERSAPQESPEAPPPYKIAVLMPGRGRGRASPPPPAYSELS